MFVGSSCACWSLTCAHWYCGPVSALNRTVVPFLGCVLPIYPRHPCRSYAGHHECVPAHWASGPLA